MLTNIPFALIGGVVGLWITGEFLSVPASVGFIALFGIATDDGVLMATYLDITFRQRKPGDRAAVREATVAAATRRSNKRPRSDYYLPRKYFVLAKDG